MLLKQKLFVFPTSRSIRSFINEQKSNSTLLPFTLTIDELFKKSIILENKKYIDEEERFLFLKESIKSIDVSKLGISDNFTKFLKQNEYIYRFFLELASEKVDINDIKIADTYDYYYEHLEILSSIKDNYIKKLNENNCVDRLNIHEHFKINEKFLNKFSSIDLVFEGYFTKVEFDIIHAISNVIDLNIEFHSNEYNQKSIDVFRDLFDEDFELNKKYKISLKSKKILEVSEIINKVNSLEIKGFTSRINQIAYIKSSITKCVQDGIDPSTIALILPDESFASQLQLFDNEKYFNYAMGKDIKNYRLYEVAYSIHSYLNEHEIKNEKNLEYLKIDKIFIEKNIKVKWNKICTKEIFTFVCDFVRSCENNAEILEKYDEIIYKLNILLFSSNNEILLKDIYKIFLLRISEIKLDDVNAGKVTVLGLLETRAVNFETIIICDFNENFIPKKSIKDKFLSTKIKQMTKLPTSFDRELLQKYYYKRLIESSKNIFISYVNSDSNQISRFANELFPKSIDEKIYDNYYRHILYNNHNISHFDENIIQRVDLTKITWSASSLKIFLQCKRKFYLQYILKLKEHTISLKPKAFELGDIVHSILEDYYKIDENSDDLTYERIERLFTKYTTSNPFLLLDLEIWKKKLYEFYLYDLKRLENRKIIGLERSFDIEFEGFKLKGIIDRVDQQDDTYEVLDYKTSSALKVDTLKNYEKSSDFQLEFYYLAMSEIYKTDKVNVYYYDLHNTKLIEEIALDKKLELLVEVFNSLKEMSNKEISFNKCEDKAVCNFCIYNTICDR
ncbi:PD-(D/E)XK nuclease family protein [Poseidonibacter lekithochrous]|uniref:PD-(D/E)XK nuclease family protein n=1 Tax=Poseidonibacter lekithochrous TaxID=1904463 RepID=UPI000D39C167|nr:PD-(D/E)XK nuclease family protein [Poseidonibacter lekithochrous]